MTEHRIDSATTDGLLEQVFQEAHARQEARGIPERMRRYLRGRFEPRLRDAIQRRRR